MKKALVEYKSSEHAAVRTKEYLYHQLFPYIGNKRKLLPLINEAIETTGVEKGSFLDLFGGSGVVSRLGKKLGYKTIINDWEPYSYFYNLAYIEQNNFPSFKELGGIEETYKHLNNLEGMHGYISEHYCPWDDENPDIRRERMFFTHKNGLKIDAMREQILDWEIEGKINLKEKAILLSSLIYSVSYISNTSGVFKGFHNGWGGKTKTALYRILSDITLHPPLLYNNKQKNKVYKMDAGKLISKLENIDITYLDPPYNQHPYGSNYHILNTIALWDKPPVNKHILQNGKKVNKSAIRTDWRTERRSAYNHKGQAIDALDNLISNIDSRFILMSYSTDGIMNLKDVLDVFASNGKLSMVTKSYKRYRVSSQRFSEKPNNIEMILILDKKGTSSRGVTNRLWKRFLEEDQWLAS